MRKGLAGAALACGLASATPGVAAETLYVAVLNVLGTNGKFIQSPLGGTEKGVGKAECELRRKAWLAEHEAGFKAAQAQLQAETGKRAEWSMECVPK